MTVFALPAPHCPREGGVPGHGSGQIFQTIPSISRPLLEPVISLPPLGAESCWGRLTRHTVQKPPTHTAGEEGCAFWSCKTASSETTQGVLPTAWGTGEGEGITFCPAGEGTVLRLCHPQTVTDKFLNL